MAQPSGQFDRFQIQHPLRQDAWGQVFLAYDPRLNCQVALQILASQWMEKPHVVERFVQVARTTLRWKNRGIARILDYGVFEDQVFCVQEYHAGKSLEGAAAKLHSEAGWIPLGEAVWLGLEICQALEYAHQRNLSHGNLTLENIWLASEHSEKFAYQPILLNTGLGLPAEAEAQPDPNRSQEDFSADILAAGRLLGFLVSGEKRILFSTQADADVPPLRALRPDLPHSLERVLLRACSPDPVVHYNSAQALAMALADTLGVARRIPTSPAGFKRSVSFQQYLQTPQEEYLETPPEEKPSMVQPLVNETAPAIQSPLEETANAGQSVIDETARVEQHLDMLHIYLTDGAIRSAPLRQGISVIGRDAENDIILDVNSISRRHAQIEYKDGQYIVTDLNSKNGAFLGEQRLAPEIPQPWEPGQDLRLGEIWLRLERVGSAQGTIRHTSQPPQQNAPVSAVLPTQSSTAESAPPTQAPGEFEQPEQPTRITQVKFSPGNGPVGAYLVETNLTVTPGKSIGLPILLYNRGARDDIFHLDVQGAPAEWMPNRPESVGLPANGQREIKLVFRPPRNSTSRAGRHAILLRVTSQNDPRQSVELRLALTIVPFSQITSEIHPRQMTPGSAGSLVLRNLGNIPETIHVSWNDHARQLRFDPKRANAVVPAGETIQINFRAVRTQPVWFGSEHSNSFTVNVAPQSGETQRHTGSLTSQALIPRWALIGLISLCLLMSCLLLVFANRLIGGSPSPRQTEDAIQTIESILQGGTEQAMLAGNAATLQAATATAQAQQADQDNDGLAYAQEMLLGTDPQNPDSDADGLKDGEEFYTFRTNPMMPDSDGDGLKDGEEILKRTNPLKRDTDGDGIEDLVDLDPLNASTPTMVATTTHTPTATATVTHTPTPPQNIANLTLLLTNNITSAIPGTNTAYTLQVRNNSPILVQDIQVIDNFPAVLLNPAWTCVASAGSACREGSGLGNIDTRMSLTPGGTGTITISALIDPAASGLLINSASLTLPNGMSDPDTSDNQVIDTDALVPTVNLDINLTDNRASAEPGDILGYMLTVTNRGPSAIFGLVVTDFFPDALTNISWTCSPTPGSSCAVSGVNTGNINTDVNLNPNGSATFAISATVNSSASGPLVNSAALISPLSPSTNNKTASDTTTIVPKADLALAVTAPVSAVPISQVTYTITVTNSGPSNVTGLTLVDELASGVTFVSSDPGLPVCTFAGNTLTCSLGELAAGEKRVVTLVVTAPVVPGVITNLVNIAADQNDPVPVNNQVTTDVLIF